MLYKKKFRCFKCVKKVKVFCQKVIETLTNYIYLKKNKYILKNNIKIKILTDIPSL